MPQILASHLAKEFRRPRQQSGPFGGVRTLFTREMKITHAVKDVSFAIEEGEIVGYLGPNGAGKSTTIKMLSGILTPTSGSASVAGITPWEDRSRNAMNIGVVFGQRSQLWWDLPLRDSLKLIGKMYRVPQDRLRRTTDMLVSLLDMEPFLDTPVRQLSLGQRMRGDLAAAVVYEPPVLFLDEPTVGLDVVAKERIREFVEEVNAEQRTTVLLTTHDLEDVQRLCKRIIIIDEGRVLFDGQLADLKRRYAPYRLLDLVVPGDASNQLTDTLTKLPKGVTMTAHEPMKATFQIDPEVIPVASVIADLSARVPVVDLGVRESPLDGIIREIYGAREVTR